MASNAQKTPIARTLNRFAEQKTRGLMQLLGKALPASVVSRDGGIVTVKFELDNTPYTLPNVTCPILGSEFVRVPIQAGTPGFVIPADAYLGGMSGLGGGVADLSSRANLSTLVWAPIGNKGWSASEDDDALVLYGPDGVVLRDSQKKTILTLTPTGIVITLPTGGRVTINGIATVNGNLEVLGNLLLSGLFEGAGGVTYPGDIKTAGAVIAGFGTGGQVGLQTHVHTQSNDSHGDTEAPTSTGQG